MARAAPLAPRQLAPATDYPRRCTQAGAPQARCLLAQNSAAPENGVHGQCGSVHACTAVGLSSTMPPSSLEATAHVFRCTCVLCLATCSNSHSATIAAASCCCCCCCRCCCCCCTMHLRLHPCAWCCRATPRDAATAQSAALFRCCASWRPKGIAMGPLSSRAHAAHRASTRAIATWQRIVTAHMCVGLARGRTEQRKPCMSPVRLDCTVEATTASHTGDQWKERTSLGLMLLESQSRPS